jgi:hypothetical protein
MGRELREEQADRIRASPRRAAWQHERKGEKTKRMRRDIPAGGDEQAMKLRLLIDASHQPPILSG